MGLLKLQLQGELRLFKGQKVRARHRIGTHWCEYCTIHSINESENTRYVVQFPDGTTRSYTHQGQYYSSDEEVSIIPYDNIKFPY